MVSFVFVEIGVVWCGTEYGYCVYNVGLVLTFFILLFTFLLEFVFKIKDGQPPKPKGGAYKII